MAGKVGPVVQLASCNGGGNQKFNFKNGMWSDIATGSTFPLRCIDRRKGRDGHDTASEIYFQIWAKPQPNGATAVLVVNNGAGPELNARIELDAAASISVQSYRVRDLYTRRDLPTITSPIFVTDAIAEHDSRMYVFTPVNCSSDQDQ